MLKVPFWTLLKKKTMKAWTDRVLHLGCRTTNRVEGAHGRVKKYFRTSVGDLGTCWEKISEILVIQLGEIQTSFGRSCTILEHTYNDIIYTTG